MKKIFLVLLNIPFIAFAQKMNIQNATLPLIESVCSDTINGKFQETVFAYDNYNRLIRIVNRVGHLEKPKNAIKSNWVFDTTAIQKFGYVSKNRAPVFKKNTSYESNRGVKMDYWQTVLLL